jgi:hypothetical protein
MFFLSAALTFGEIVITFHNTNNYGLITKVMFYLVNVTLLWMSIV